MNLDNIDKLLIENEKLKHEIRILKRIKRDEEKQINSLVTQYNQKVIELNAYKNKYGVQNNEQHNKQTKHTKKNTNKTTQTN